jgi:hypothetical protein
MAIPPDLIATATQLMQIFFPHAHRVRTDFVARKGRFVHYTSAANALSIVNSKRIWMRNSTCMADYREVQHGRDSLVRYFRVDEQRDAFKQALEECSQGAADEALRLFDQWWQDTELQTYITSISEHDEKEDMHGRLSMWRAFGGGAAPRVALVVNIPLEVGVNAALNAVLSPVGYFTDAEVKTELDTVVANIKSNCAFLKGIPREMLIGSIFTMLVTSVVCMKPRGVPRRTGMAHLAFTEAHAFPLVRTLCSGREWHSPNRLQDSARK